MFKLRDTEGIPQIVYRVEEVFMRDDVLKYQCPVCTGVLHFESRKQRFICEYCGMEYKEDYFETKKLEQKAEQEDIALLWKEKGTIKEPQMMVNQTGFICTSCGAEIVVDNNTSATECVYCGNPIILTEHIEGVIKPDKIIPFKINKQEAEQILKAFYEKKILLPKIFKDEDRIRKISGVYVPFWLFSGKGVGTMTFEAEKESTHIVGDYTITRTKYYEVTRKGSMVFENIPIDVSQKMEDSYMDRLEPYDYRALKPFSTKYMAGVYADQFDVDYNKCAVRAKRRLINSTKRELAHTVKGYSDVTVMSEQIDMKDESVQYALLPVWMLNTQYKGKLYHFAINGQTGKVWGDLPIDKKKKRFIFWIFFIISYMPLAITAYWLFSM